MNVRLTGRDPRPENPDGNGKPVPAGWSANPARRRQRLLYFTRNAGYEHSVVHRQGAPSLSERVLADMGFRAGFDVACTKDGSVFDEDLGRYDGFVFFTLGDLTETEGLDTPPMTLRGKQRLLDAVASGAGFLGLHSAADTFCSDGVDPYIEMLGAEFCGHGVPQRGTMLVKSPRSPGLQGLARRFSLDEEWYAFKKVTHDMHVILALDTSSLQGALYNRPPMPSTWARRYGKGRVFYTSLGHREETWTDPRFHQIVLAGLSWSLGNVDADVRPNFEQATPGGDQYCWTPPEPGTISR